MANAKGPTAQLCDWACSTGYSDLPADVLKETVNVLYDTVGGMIVGSRLPTCLPVVEMVKAMGAGNQCTIVGHTPKTTVTYAALANGTIAQADEVDPSGQHGSGHFAAVTVPTAISVGQYAKVSGKDLVRALALGSEVAARVNNVLAGVFEYRERHFQRSIIGSPLGAAIVAGTLLKLNTEQMEHALSLAAYHVGGLNSFFYESTHQSKSLQYGVAAQGSVQAALLAQRGFHGPPQILTIEHGFFDTFAEYAHLGNNVVTDLGNTYHIRQIAYKRFPVGGHDQAPLYAFLQLMKANNLTADDVELVEVDMLRNAYVTVANMKHPAVYLPTILSIAAVFGEVTFQHIHQASYYEDARVAAFRERVRMLPDPGTGKWGGRLESEVRVRTRNGKLLVQRSCYPLMTEEELQRKFRYLVGLRVGKDKVLDLEKKLKSIEAADNIAPLIDELEMVA